MAAKTSRADVDRLSAVIARQRRELDLMRGQAAVRSVVDMARGVLMERLGCSAEEAGRQLVRVAHSSGTPLAELAAEVTGELLAHDPEVGLPADGVPDPALLAAEPSAARPEDAAGGSDAAAGLGWGRLSVAGAAVERAEDGNAVATAALEEVLAPTGARAVGLWVRGLDDGLHLVGQAGLGAREAGRWRYLPPDMDSLPQRAARSGEPVLWPDGRPATEPCPVPGEWLTGARASMPMRGERGLRGVLTVCWQQKLGSFEPPVLRQLTALAHLCAQALSAAGPGASGWAAEFAWLLGLLDGAIESVMVAFPVRADDGSVTDFRIEHVSSGFRDPSGRSPAELARRPLLEVYPLAALPDGLFDHAVGVLTSGVPDHISGGVRSALAGGAGAIPSMDTRIAPLLDGVVIATRQVDEAERLASLLQHAERLGHMGAWEENLLTNEVRWTEPALSLFGRGPGAAVPLSQLHAYVVADDVFDLERFRDTLLREKRSSAAAFRINRADDQSMRQMRVFAEPVTDPAGELTAVRGVFQDVSTHYHTQVALTATSDRLADTQQRAEEEHRLAVRLQQAITPWSTEPVVAGVDIAARYRPAGPAGLVSGDWYDAVPLPSGQMLLVVGDIAGHGIEAVTGMVGFRNCLRGLAVTGAGPATLLSWLNQHAYYLTAGTIGTAVCGLYDPDTRNLRWSRAGHLPPVLVRGGTAHQLELRTGLLLGADPQARYEEVSTVLQPGDVLLLYTDGLVERRDEAIDDSLAALLHYAGRPVSAIGSYADFLMHHADADTGDDVCLVAVRIR
ncbi:MAG TPA: SpoIIE family protein phosphatase [Streptosporangiaceae bacterium]|nr:SpoIIE family protein phosphatase [Streptosporangiaceae bacterium]